MAIPVCEVVDCSGDVLTGLNCDYVTARATDTRMPGDLHSLASQLFRHESEIGNDIRPWGMAGYKGFKCGEVEIGVLDGDVLVRMHSTAAALNWKRIVALSERVTRIDLQATVRVPSDSTGRLETHRRQALSYSACLNDRLIVRRVDDNRGGYTLYLGARESNVFGRIYDKGAQDDSPQWERCIRFEVQFNSRLANGVSRYLESLSSPKLGFAGYIRRFFEGRGVQPPALHTAALTYCSPRKRTDADRKLLWLAESVRPSVLALIALGRGEEVLRALGLVDEDVPELVHMDYATLN